nr:PREDICTED: uncharacterized protein LOC104142224 [Struthio camelus australis]
MTLRVHVCLRGHPLPKTPRRVAVRQQTVQRDLCSAMSAGAVLSYGSASLWENTVPEASETCTTLPLFAPSAVTSSGQGQRNVWLLPGYLGFLEMDARLSRSGRLVRGSDVKMDMARSGDDKTSWVPARCEDLTLGAQRLAPRLWQPKEKEGSGSPAELGGPWRLQTDRPKWVRAWTLVSVRAGLQAGELPVKSDTLLSKNKWAQETHGAWEVYSLALASKTNADSLSPGHGDDLNDFNLEDALYGLTTKRPTPKAPRKPAGGTDFDLADYFDTPLETTTKPAKPTAKPFPKKPDNSLWDVVRTTTTKKPKTTRSPPRHNPAKDPMDFDLADAIDKNDGKGGDRPNVRPGEGMSACPSPLSSLLSTKV